MDTSQEDTVGGGKEASGAPRRQQRSIAEKRRIAEETLVEGASVARVARTHGINANQVFGWRRLYLAGRLGEQRGASAVESRRQRVAQTRKVKKKTKVDRPMADVLLPNIAYLIEDGKISIGSLRPIGCVATAVDEDCTYAMLVRRVEGFGD